MPRRSTTRSASCSRRRKISTRSAAPGDGASRARGRAKCLAGVKRRADVPLLDNLLIFGRVLRRAGFDVHPGACSTSSTRSDTSTSARATRCITRAARCSSIATSRFALFDRAFARSGAITTGERRRRAQQPRVARVGRDRGHPRARRRRRARGGRVGRRRPGDTRRT